MLLLSLLRIIIITLGPHEKTAQYCGVLNDGQIVNIIRLHIDILFQTIFLVSTKVIHTKPFFLALDQRRYNDWRHSKATSRH